MSQAYPWRSAPLDRSSGIRDIASAYSEQLPSSTNPDVDDDDETFEESTSEFASVVLSEKGPDCRG